MSSWSSSHPPRPERSRSPSRGYYGRPPYPDSGGHPGDPYWDQYNRDRQWPDYERGRGGYDYGRRGRSRSPPYDDANRKRRRSMSPYDRERYDPRPRYNDYDDAHSRGYGHMSPRSRSQYGHGYPPPRSSRGPPDPHTLDYPASLKQYAEWFRFYYPQQANEEDIADKAAEQGASDGSKPRNGIKSRWEKYKKEFQAQQLQTLFDHHRKSPWFAEKYDPSPEFVNLRLRVRKRGWKGRLNQFLNDLEEGKFDPSDSENEIKPTSPASREVKEETNGGENGAIESPNQEMKREDDDFNELGAEEEVADIDSARFEANGRSGDISKLTREDEMAVFPEGNQVMIRTIPPDIGRVKLENAMKDLPGFVYLALGDPMQKRNYYRAGWIKFTEDADIPSVMGTLSEKKIEGFKLHMTHSMKPFVNKIRQAPEVASRPERIVKDLEQVKVLTKIMEAEYDRVRTFKEKLVAEAEDDASGQGGEERTEVDMDSEQVDEDMAEPGERGSEAVERRIEKVKAEMPDATTERLNEIALDFYLSYLRAAFHTCYYCASTSDHLEEMQRKCVQHVRKTLSKSLAPDSEPKVKDEEKDGEKNGEKEKEPDKGRNVYGRDKGVDTKRNDDRWLEWLDNKIALLINRDGVDPRDYGGKSYDEELAKAVEAHIKQEEEGKFRCKTCSKLFKATSFVEKHVANKHPELIKQLDELPYYNNFALDPQRIQPFSHPPNNAVGPNQAPPQAYGLPGPAFGEHGRPPPVPYYNPYAAQQMFSAFASSMAPVDQYGGNYPLPPPFAYPPPQGRGLRDDISHGGSGRRLSDRISGYAPGHDSLYPTAGPMHGIEGLPVKPMVTLEPGPGVRKNGRAGPGGPPPPPPPDAKEDPRAAAGRKVSYYDMDLVAEGDVELNY